MNSLFIFLFALATGTIYADPTAEEVKAFQVVTCTTPAFELYNSEGGGSGALKDYDKYWSLFGYQHPKAPAWGLFHAKAHPDKMKLLTGIQLQEKASGSRFRIRREGVGDGFDFDVEGKSESRLGPLLKVEFEDKITSLETIDSLKVVPPQLRKSGKHKREELEVAGLLEPRALAPFFSFKLNAQETIVGFMTSTESAALAVFHPELTIEGRRAPFFFPRVKVNRMGKKTVVQAQLTFEDIPEYFLETSIDPKVPNPLIISFEFSPGEETKRWIARALPTISASQRVPPKYGKGCKNLLERWEVLGSAPL
jgi:hypothetical protein